MKIILMLQSVTSVLQCVYSQCEGKLGLGEHDAPPPPPPPRVMMATLMLQHVT